MSTLTEKLRQFVSADPQAGTGPVQAVWNGVVIAESDRTVVIEGNHYFPPDDVNTEYLESTSKRTACPWKGTASYYDIVIDGERNKAAGWYYPQPSHAASQIKDHVAFWHGVKVKRTAQQ
ncbi:MAG TPA: DUF427 domain-containing protein [Solirubrobacteraceae bacterium]|nr:DUF427 domain-containing protein [Solirubrobacteraceae bacterium]